MKSSSNCSDLWFAAVAIGVRLCFGFLGIRDTPNNECNTNDLILQAYGDAPA